jgi:hypothetical protein
MRKLNEYISREANKEDGCTSRFNSLPSMVITLGANMDKTPGTSAHTIYLI